MLHLGHIKPLRDAECSRHTGTAKHPPVLSSTGLLASAGTHKERTAGHSEFLPLHSLADPNRYSRAKGAKPHSLVLPGPPALPAPGTPYAFALPCLPLPLPLPGLCLTLPKPEVPLPEEFPAALLRSSASSELPADAVTLLADKIGSSTAALPLVDVCSSG